LISIAGGSVETGKHSTGKGWRYIESLSDVDSNVLKRILTKAYKSAKKSCASKYIAAQEKEPI